MPVTSEHRSGVGGELQQAALVSPHVPQLDVTVLGHGGERVRLVGAELDVADGFCVAGDKDVYLKTHNLNWVK